MIYKRKFAKCGKVSVGDNFTVKEPNNIYIGNNVCFGNNTRLACYEEHFNILTGYKPSLRIGNDVSIGSFCYISCLNQIEISDGVLTGDFVYISDNFHGMNSIDEIKIRPAVRKLCSKGPIYIGKNVWIGRNVCIMPNVTIGDYSVIGANSVVTHDIPSYAIAAGCPAKIIKYIKN